MMESTLGADKAKEAARNAADADDHKVIFRL